MTLAGEQVLVNQLIDAVALRVGVGCGFKINVDFQMEQRYQRALVFTGLESLDPAVAWLWIGAEHDAASRRELIAGLRCVPIIYFQTRVQLCHFGLNRRTVLHHKQKKKRKKERRKNRHNHWLNSDWNLHSCTWYTRVHIKPTKRATPIWCGRQYWEYARHDMVSRTWMTHSAASEMIARWFTKPQLVM